MLNEKVTLPKFRISTAAVGRRLSSVILRARRGELSEEDFLGTINAVFDSCIEEVASSGQPQEEVDMEAVEATEPSRNTNERVNEQVLAAEQDEIEKSVRRSTGARKASVRRRQLREERKKQDEAAVAEKIKKAVDEAVAEVKTRYRDPYENYHGVYWA